ncbi:DUF4362 domain-containing protein [Aneurinibacillus migulanus]|uniref:DUF4362 domain-containing protein n=1 Tax=Aneurinibacillus migulanus TaxID=47500 RepID=A0A1G8GMP3_ANEMI|nr:DUF4362 domain-containing protein [Aneurinibacillus migulanus]MED0891076.1 DUF4362 domain-containing protein [Aneurinibacillus migulanus]MED1614236.1 DUF4362 domain-containing protein [Aneurinibacillus migulanus]GED17043.1 hypothetical protein AMI01nite_50340 [Aneurinibacillus migulanus]SDH95659.1 protein of unknown function [Aneurinibacillus migulanus]
MRKIVVFLIAIVLISCKHEQSPTNNWSSTKQQDETGYPLEMAMRSGDVVGVHGQVFNLEKLEVFMLNVQKKKDSNVKIVQYTIEGDPIFRELDYEGGRIHIVIDNAADKFTGTGKGKSKVTCSQIKKETSREKAETRYFLDGCNGESVEVLSTYKKPAR